MGVEPTRSRLLFAVVLTGAVLVAEVVGGLLAHSLALLSDAAHVLTDLVSLLLTLGAILMATRPVTKQHTFGWHRGEVLAALANGLLLLGVSVYLLWEAYLRVQSPHAVRVDLMLVVAVAGLAANGVIVFRLRGHSHSDLNVQSAYLHVVADFAASIGVVVAAVIILMTGWNVVDPIVSIMITVVVMGGAIRLLRETVHILLEGVPRSVDLEEVAATLRRLPGVEDIHDLHIWTICSNLLALSVHITVGKRSSVQRDEIVKAVNDELRVRYGITETTLQTEEEPCRTNELIHLVPHHNEAEGH